MAKADELKKTAETAQAKPKEEKPLPAMVSPTVNLAPELREAVAKRCRDTEESFSVKTNKMWFDLLKQEGRVKADLKVDFAAKRPGAKASEKIAAQEKQIAELQAELAALKAQRK